MKTSDTLLKSIRLNGKLEPLIIDFYHNRAEIQSYNYGLFTCFAYDNLTDLINQYKHFKTY